MKNRRTWKYIVSELVDKSHENLNKWKIIIPRANGRGEFGEALSQPAVLKPFQGYTQTFIGIGAFDSQSEAEALLLYVKTKFARALLSTLKSTQHNERDTWANVPLQNFTDNSDIDWSKSISEIDQQLYKKYGLTQEEIDFIEKNVVPME